MEPTKRYAELITERTVERFLQRLFLREPPVRALCVVAPFISPLTSSRFSLAALRTKVEREKVPTYVVTRQPDEPYQQEAMDVLRDCPWIELRYNPSVHAKLYVAHAKIESESFALFGSGNLTARSIETNVELAMMVYSKGPGRGLVKELYYWASVRLRTLAESQLVQRIRAQGRR
jgi:phosphatidylserine/phosphatidylglycerophosphate/cardiolipin synthase-like enzyme